MSWYPSSFADQAATQAATEAATQTPASRPQETAQQAVGRLRRAAAAEGCTRIKLFTQMVGPVREALAKEGSAEGVCRELAVRWLGAKKARDGDNFLDALLGLGGSVKEEELKKVVEAFKAMGDRNVLDQRAYTETELKAYFEFVSPTEVLRAPLRSDQGPRISAADWLLASADQRDYRFFGIRGGINHATAVCLAKEKESFFDPNLGEFEFKARPDAMRQFLNKYVFPEGGPGRGQYIGIVGDRFVLYDVERICCA